MIGCSPGADHDNGSLAQNLVVGSAQGLAINGNHLPFGDVTHFCDPTQKASLKLVGVQCRENTTKRIMRGNAIGQLQEGLQPLELRLPERLHLYPTVCATDHGTDGNDDNV